VTLARRVAAVETTLTPTELVVRWLEEAHAHGGLEAYVRSIIADPTVLPPADELARAAASGARASLRGKGAEAIGKAVDGAIRETIFRFELVLRINPVSHELIDRQMLLDGVFSGQLAMLATDGQDAGRRDIAYLERFAQLRQLIIGRLDELEAAGQARLSVEERNLAGHLALFPDGAAAWAEQLERSRTIGRLAVALAEKDGLPLPPPQDPDARAVRVTQLIDNLVEPAKVIALEQLGEGRRALGIATGWLRGKMAAGPDRADRSGESLSASSVDASSPPRTYGRVRPADNPRVRGPGSLCSGPGPRRAAVGGHLGKWGPSSVPRRQLGRTAE
jgi:hypothetical protein